MSRVEIQCGRMFRLDFWSDAALYGDPNELKLLQADPMVLARVGDRPILHVGTVNEMSPLWVEEADPQGAVFSRWMLGGEHAVDQVADRRKNLVGIADLLELIWGPHRDAFTLPWDDAHRSTASDILSEVARENPLSTIDFWRYSFFRQYDIHIRV